jgi:hypothetical protein
VKVSTAFRRAFDKALAFIEHSKGS